MKNRGLSLNKIMTEQIEHGLIRKWKGLPMRGHAWALKNPFWSLTCQRQALRDAFLLTKWLLPAKLEVRYGNLDDANKNNKFPKKNGFGIWNRIFGAKIAKQLSRKKNAGKPPEDHLTLLRRLEGLHLHGHGPP